MKTMTAQGSDLMTPRLADSHLKPDNWQGCVAAAPVKHDKVKGPDKEQVEQRQHTFHGHRVSSLRRGAVSDSDVGVYFLTFR
ncbi:hypothetical protein F2P81_003981 [Scophthalmus maximus]|uniref:Uncharacterized protein n=1 Tax=Scophthalmus maximus TaxID=52904 RepID=A0A6A4TFP5_SCOMX|nr:hypothetical protein F2P81_003981 [Scophthalmus maximus]